MDEVHVGGGIIRFINDSAGGHIGTARLHGWIIEKFRKSGRSLGYSFLHGDISDSGDTSLVIIETHARNTPIRRELFGE